MVDSNENILVEFDYDNITLIDPNKVVDDFGNVSERLVKQENLVYYANLECSVLPRTKLAVGTSFGDNQRTISVGKINFLNPGFKDFLDTSWSDELTGKDTLQGRGVNQKKIDQFLESDKSNEYYYTQSTYSNGKPNVVDTGLLGIKDINMSMGQDFLPVVEITLEDVKGRALFEAGNNSPYAAFFQLPYPLFTLTLKGYYGKAVKYPLMLRSFTSNFDPSSHNFIIRLKFYGYKYTLLSYINFGSLMAVPHMYKNLVTIPSKINETNQTVTNTNQNTFLSSKGYEKMREIYSDYKSKGMIPEDFPELTLNQLRYRLDEFIKKVLSQFTKENLGVLTEINNYVNSLLNFQQTIYTYTTTSWFNQFMDTKQPIILNNGLTVYTFNPDLTPENKEKWSTELKGRIQKYETQLNGNSVFGKTPGTYTVGGTTYPSRIEFKITENTFYKSINPETDVNWEKTYQFKNPTSTVLDGTYTEKLRTYKTSRLKQLEPYKGQFFFFEGPGSFMFITEKMAKQSETFKKEIETRITENLKAQFNNKQYGLGFVPTIRNILAVFYCQGEAFLRLLDEVHKKAWDVRNDSYRRAAIFGNSSTAPSVDIKTSTQNNEPIYPWPQVIKETTTDGKDEKFEIVYPGAPDVAFRYRSYTPEIWPEVQFVEEFIKGYTYRDEDFKELSDNQTNTLNKPRRISLNSIDFPTSNQIYQNKQQAKYFYEIYERVILNAYYSKLSRQSGYPLSIYNVEAENEALNILESLSSSSPFLSKILKEYLIDNTNFEVFLRHISNEGQGESWQDFIRGIFVTPYIKNEVENPNSIFNRDILENTKSQPDIELKTQSYKTNIEKYIGDSSTSNFFDFTDIYPLPDLDWDKKYLADGEALNGSTSAFDTKLVLEYNDNQKTISNFETGENEQVKRPITNFNYFDIPNNLLSVRTGQSFRAFYDTRLIKNQVVTEGNLFYNNYNGNLSESQTVSMLNTPYFINAIQNGLYNFRYKPNESSPYKAAAYLFLEGLPLATTKEKYKTYGEGGAATDLNYIMATLKKFGAIHKLPYAWILKYGGIWNRYKVWKETGVDFLDDVWTDFNYLRNFDPISSASTTNYPLTIDGNLVNIVLDQTTNAPTPLTDINIGFYPQLIDDFNVFLQGTKLLTGTSLVQGVCEISGNTMTVSSISSNNMFVGALITGLGISGNTTIVNQTTGTTGGIGTYTVIPSQTASTTNFTIQNLIVNGPSSVDMQSLINDKKLVVFNDPSSNLNLPPLFDPNNLTRSLKLTTWSVIVKSQITDNYFVFPSFGFNQSQIYAECFKDGRLDIELSQNKAMFNGSVRLFWNAPTWGYFDNSSVKKNDPDTYLKSIFPDQSTQQNFLITGEQKDYSYLDDMFSAFDKQMLDLFETHFLNFSKSIYDYTDIVPPTLEFNLADLNQPSVQNLNSTETTSELYFKNFQGLMRELLKIGNPSFTSGSQTLTDVINAQNTVFQNILKNFLEYDVILKYGNPSGFNRQTFFTFSSQFIQDPIVVDPYIKGTLPGDGFIPNTTLANSKTQNPEVWNALETYVGFSTIPKLEYKNNGSYITDFFIDMNVGFNEKNVVDFAPLIKIYATQKLNQSNLNISSFYSLMDDYLLSSKEYLNNVLSVLMTSVRNELPTVIISPDEGSVRANLEAGFTEQTRVELWETFKSLNDQWISGYDFNDKTLFEDVMLMDRGSRDIGNKILVDIFEIKELIEDGSYKNTLLGMIETILKNNNFVTYMLPAYINFYNVQDAQLNPTPRIEGTTEFARTLFGTYLNVDYRNSSPKYICVYANKPSEHLAMNENVDYRFRDDAFDLRRASDNPLLESQQNKTDWSRSNKVVGFNVDMTLQNQQIFKQFDVAQDPGKPTSESLEVLNQMANLSRNRRTSTQNVSLYNLYKNRSYTCSIDMMGNALIQPTMYFNIRNIPMFSGPYMITTVRHRISENGFDTTFEGIRQPFYSLPKIDNFIQSLNQNILQSIQQTIQQNETKKLTDPNTIIQEKNNVLANIQAEETLTANQDCATEINSRYLGFTQVETPVNTKVMFQEMKNLIRSKFAAKGYRDKLDQYTKLMYSFIFVDSSTETGFESYDNNFSTIDLKQYYSNYSDFFNKKYYCVNRGTNINYPIVSFINLSSFLDFAINKVEGLIQTTTTATTLAEYLAELYVTRYPVPRSEKVWTEMTQTDKDAIIEKFKQAIISFDSLI
jgi:hypothetical protein